MSTSTKVTSKELISLAAELGRRLRLADPLPENVDFNETEDEAIQDHLNEVLELPKRAIPGFWSAFIAGHVIELATAIKKTNNSTQPLAMSTYIQVLSLFDDPKHEPYFRRFLRSEHSKDLPNAVAAACGQGIRFISPSNAGKVCTLLIHFLFWCDASRGDDGNASFDMEHRVKIAEKLVEAEKKFPEPRSLPPSNDPNSLRYQSVEIRRLAGILKIVINNGQVPDWCPLCDDDEAELVCSKCKTVRYCGKAHQAQHWKTTHKLQCFQTPF